MVKNLRLVKIFVCFMMIISVCFLVACGSGTKKLSYSDNIQKIMDASVGEELPGMIVGISTSEGEFYGSSGMADTATKEKMDVDMQVRIAGVTKQFTAALIMKLVEDGKLSLNDTLEDILPGTGIPHASEITVGQLLNHTSGLTDHELSEDFVALLKQDPHRAWSSDEIIGLIKKEPNTYLPGEVGLFSNSGYYLLGLIAEKAIGHSVEKSMQDMFFTPYDMGSTAVNRSGELTLSHPSHYGFGTQDFTDMNYSWDFASGSGVSSARDMIVWSKALFAGEIVSKDTLQKMLTPVAPSNNVGYGFSVSDPFGLGGNCVWLNGANPGSCAFWINYPDKDIHIFIFANSFYLSEDPAAQVSKMVTAAQDIVETIKTHEIDN